MFPKEVIEILEKYKENNSGLLNSINENLSAIIEKLYSVNQSLAEQIKNLILDKDADNNVDEVINDSKILRNYIKSIELLNTSNNSSDNQSTETSEELTPIFEKRVYPYLVSDDICPLCNVKLINRTIFYQRNINNELINETVLWHKCPACNKLFVLDFEAEDFDFNNTNIILNKEKYNEIPSIDIYSVIVLSNTLKCSSNHKTKDIIAKIPILNKYGEISYLKINASYCFECNRFAILKDDFYSIKDIIMCKVVDETIEYQNSDENDFEIEQKKSILFQYGYNVQTKKNLSEQQRHIILSSLIESHIMERRDVINHINTLIERGSKIPSWSNATQKWKEDRKFVSEYKSDTLPEVIFDNIILKYRKPK